MRGQRTLFQNVLPEPATAEAVTRGRSPELDARRNALLCARYAYYTLYFPMYRYEAIIEHKLQHEFFLSPSRITDLLQANVGEVSRIKREKPAMRWFKSQWPCWSWPIQ